MVKKKKKRKKNSATHASFTRAFSPIHCITTKEKKTGEKAGWKKGGRNTGTGSLVAENKDRKTEYKW